MMEDRDDLVYNVVMNHEQQYSIWPAGRDMPTGWRPAGKRGTKQECLDWLDDAWTDMRPLSLRNSQQAPKAGEDRA
jgi:MbtH protein